MQFSNLRSFKDEMDDQTRKYFQGKTDALLYKDLGDDVEIQERENYRREQVQSQVIELMKVIDSRDHREQFANLKDPEVILELNKRVFDQYIKESTSQSYNLQQRISSLEQYSFWQAEAPEEITRLVSEIILKVKLTNFSFAKKPSIDEEDGQYKKAEVELF